MVSFAGPTGKKVALCCKPGCLSKVVARQVCYKHGANGPCTIPGCKSKIVARGLCTKHGAHGGCRINRCTISATANGFCSKHARPDWEEREAKRASIAQARVNKVTSRHIDILQMALEMNIHYHCICSLSSNHTVDTATKQTAAQY